MVLCSQEINYSITLIPDSLKENADVVIRKNMKELIINDASSAVLKVKEIKTILKKSGEEHAFLIVPYSKFYKVSYIKGKIYDKSGNLIRKIKKKDIFDISHYDGFSLYTDNRLKLIRKPAENPPYTVEYEYEINFKGILSFPSWQPVPDYRVAVQNSQFKISGMNINKYRTKTFNFKSENSKNAKLFKNDYFWSVENFKAIEKETFNRSIKNIVPYVLVAPSDFVLDNYSGNADSWENFGAWIAKLNADRNSLPEETIKKIKMLTKDAVDDKEKAKIVYEYMQSKTRYVNIALGIGGWQPFKAEDTDKNGYGDCKALSYYTKSLLEIVGVKSHYVIVHAGKDATDMRVEFPSIQFNHATLCLPFENDTIWLECTSQIAPFGYIGTFTDDRDVLIIDSDGKGKIAHTTIYPEEVNTQFRYAEIDLDETGGISSKIKTVYAGLQYENVWRILDLSEEEKEKKLNKRIAIPNMKINKFSFVDNKDIIPSVEENLEINVKNYASVSSDRMFLVPNILNRKENIPRKIKDRKTDIVFRRGFTDADTIIYNIPEGFNLEYLPENITESNKFGSYEVSYHFENSKLTYIRKRIIHKGTFPPEKYEDLRAFYKLMYNADKKAIVFVRKQ